MGSEKHAMCDTHMSAAFNHSKAINTPNDIIYLTLLHYSFQSIFCQVCSCTQHILYILILLVIKMKALNTILDINFNSELNCELYIQPLGQHVPSF